MGAYISQTYIETKISTGKIIQLTDDDKTGVVNVVKLEVLVSEAEGEADAYLSAKLSVPLKSVPPVVQAKVYDIWLYLAYGGRKGATEDVKERYERAIAFFKDVGTRKASLGEDIIPDVRTIEGGSVGTKGTSDRKFTDKTLENF